MATKSEKSVDGYPGLYIYGLEHDHYAIKKSVKGIKINKRLGCIPEDEAKAIYHSMVDAARNGRTHQARPAYTVTQLMNIYIEEKKEGNNLRTFPEIVRDLKRVIEPEFGHIIASEFNANHARAFIKKWETKGLKRTTINNQLANLSRIFTHAHVHAVDPVTQLSYLPYPITIPRPEKDDPTEEDQLLIDTGELEADEKEPYLLSQHDEIRLLSNLPEAYRVAVKFILYTGLRTKNLRKLRWSQETTFEGFDETIFKLPGAVMKNKRPWILVLNSVARDILEAQRGVNAEYVFANCHGKPFTRLLTGTWMEAWRKAGLPTDNPNISKGPHNLRHTFGMRLRSGGVSEQDQNDLMAHYDKSMARRYAAPILDDLHEASESVVQRIKLKAV